MTDMEQQRRTALTRRAGFETSQPGDRSRLPLRRRIWAYLLAIVLPMLTAAAMIPLRIDHGRVAVLVLVIPVVVVALLGAVGPAVVAAASAVLAYDLFLVEPYYNLAIADTDEIVAAVTLFAVALVVGVLSARLVRFHERDSARREELRHLIAFARVVTAAGDRALLTDAACEHITSVLNLRRCTWQPGEGESTAPILMPDGNLMGRLSDLNPDRATLPANVEIPVRVDGVLVGRFALVPTTRHVASYEERLTATTIAELFGRATTG